MSMNPISYARYLSTHSSTSLAKKLGVSRQYISRLEQGLYDKPNDKLLSWATEQLNKHLAEDKQTNNEAVQQLYREWQWMHRESSKMSHIIRPLEITEYHKARQPNVMYYYKIFAEWRSDYWISTHAFCVDFCLHPSPVVDYEEGNTRSMPTSLKEVMGKLGLLGSGFKTNER